MLYKVLITLIKNDKSTIIFDDAFEAKDIKQVADFARDRIEESDIYDGDANFEIKITKNEKINIK